MAHFDRQLAKQMTKVLQDGDLETQAQRVNDILGYINDFADTLRRAKNEVGSINAIEKQIRQLERKEELSDAETEALRILQEDLETAENLEREYNRCRDEINDFQNAAANLYRSGKKL